MIGCFFLKGKTASGNNNENGKGKELQDSVEGASDDKKISEIP